MSFKLHSPIKWCQVLNSCLFVIVLSQEKRGNREHTRLQKVLDDCREITDSSLLSVTQQLQDNVDTANRTCIKFTCDLLLT